MVYNYGLLFSLEKREQDQNNEYEEKVVCGWLGWPFVEPSLAEKFSFGPVRSAGSRKNFFGGRFTG